MLTLIRCPFHPYVTAVARKRPGHSAKSAGSRLQLNTHTPLIQTMIQTSRSRLTMPLSMRSLGTYQETSSHANVQGTLGHSRPSSLSHRGLILALKSGIRVRANPHLKIKKERTAGGERMIQPSSKNALKRGKSHHFVCLLVSVPSPPMTCTLNRVHHFGVFRS